MDAPQQYRLFVALEVIEAVKDRVAEAQERMRMAAGPAAVRWTGRDQWHLTLKFLGNVEVERVPDLVLKLGRAVVEYPRLELVAEGVGFFPSPRSPRVIWVGVRDGAGELSRVHLAVEAACGGFSDEQPEKHFAGHLTIGRVKNIARPQVDALNRAAQANSGELGRWTEGSISLVRSELSPKGSRYTILARVPLRGTPS